MMTRKSRYEVWFADDPLPVILRGSTLKSMIKRRTFIHTPILRFRKLPDENTADGPLDPEYPTRT